MYYNSVIETKNTFMRQSNVYVQFVTICEEPKVSNLNRNGIIKFCPLFGHRLLVSDIACKINTKYGFLKKF